MQCVFSLAEDRKRAKELEKDRHSIAQARAADLASLTLKEAEIKRLEKKLANYEK